MKLKMYEKVEKLINALSPFHQESVNNLLHKMQLPSVKIMKSKHIKKGSLSPRFSLLLQRFCTTPLDSVLAIG